MISLLQIEWMKIRRYRTFWILGGLFVVVLILWNYEIAAGVFKFGPPNMPAFGSSYSFPAVWANLGWWASLFIMFISILVMTVTCNEYTFRTHRQNVIDGWSRLQFFHAKVLLVVSISLGLTLLQWILGIAFALGSGSSLSEMTGGMSALGYYFILCLNYLGAGLLIALLIRRSGLAIALFMIYSLFVETGLHHYLNHLTSGEIGSFLPLQSSDQLLPWPMIKALATMSNKPAAPGLSDSYFVIASGLWIIGYYFAGRLLVTKRDL